MNEYAVVKEQEKGKLSKRMPFTYRPETVGVSTLLYKKFSNAKGEKRLPRHA
ncbi:hypothetical protein [Anaerotruncus colihominis]|uniref:hypothetical protein n=1 Tax=Anaerotruncus colihominis TaxID=169435 RepID=UPI0029439786|nr:hypothetical protein [Anaerotruncus colihominis]